MCGAPFSTKGLQAQAAGTDKGRLNKSPGQYQTGGQGFHWAGNIWTKRI